MERAGSPKSRQSESARKIKSYRDQYFGTITKTWNEPKRLGGEITGNSAKGKFLGEEK